MNAPNDHNAGKPVTLSPADVRHAVRLLELLTAGDDPVTEGANSATHSASREGLLAVARFSYLARQGRTDHFSPAMFGEPPWDILLSLYIKANDGSTPTISCLAKDGGIAMSTAFRWIDYLEKKQFVRREPNRDDGRASTISLTNEGRQRLERYFTDVLVRMAATREEIDGQIT